MKLSTRLMALADMVKDHKQGSILADIGTDHGYLPCFLCEKKIIVQAYACDVTQGPYESSKSTIREYQRQDDVFALLGDGLDPIVDKHVDMITIAGMGAYLISEILDRNLDYIDEHILFLQPNANSDHLRKYLYEHGFDIIDEKMVQEGHHIYEMMVAIKKENVQYTAHDIMFGPVLKKEKSDIFISYWHKQYETCKKICQSLPDTHQRYIELTQLMKMMEDVL